MNDRINYFIELKQNPRLFCMYMYLLYMYLFFHGISVSYVKDLDDFDIL